MLKGSRINNIRFTSAVRPRTGEVVPACKNCTSIFKEAFR
jgi:filamentous hemagglutinin